MVTSEPKNLGVKIGSAEEKAWTEIVKSVEKRIAEGLRENAINEAILDFATKKVAEERKAFENRKV